MFQVMPFGLYSLDRVIVPEMMPHAFAYLNNIIVLGKTLEEHRDNLQEVFRRLRADNLRITIDKCDFFKKYLKYVGLTGRGMASVWQQST